MEIQQLRYFLAAANCSNFSRAAKQCFTSRQNIAHAMNVLERELGITLFERKGNGVELTSAGQQVACHADDIVSRVDSLQALFAATSSTGEGLSIAVTYNLLSKIPEETESFIFKFDRWINLFEMGCEDCYRAVCSGEADVGLALCMRRGFDDCNFEEIGHLKAYAIVNEHSPLAQKSQLSIFDLRTQRLQIMSESAFQYEPLFAQLGRKYGKTSAQIILRWHIQAGNIVIPGSKNPDHIRDNFDLFDFALTEEEMAQIAAMDQKKRYYTSSPELLKRYAQMVPPVDEQK